MEVHCLVLASSERAAAVYLQPVRRQGLTAHDECCEVLGFSGCASSYHCALGRVWIADLLAELLPQGDLVTDHNLMHVKSAKEDYHNAQHVGNPNQMRASCQHQCKGTCLRRSSSSHCDSACIDKQEGDSGTADGQKLQSGQDALLVSLKTSCASRSPGSE